jgi:hypothetical protein
MMIPRVRIMVVGGRTLGVRIRTRNIFTNPDTDTQLRRRARHKHQHQINSPIGGELK